MKKRVLYFFLVIFLSFLSSQAATFRTDTIYSRWMCNSYGLSKMGSWDYVPGLVAKSVGKTWEQYKDSTWSVDFWTAIKNYADAYTPSTSYSTLDNMNPGKMYHEVYRGAVLKGISSDVYATKAGNVYTAFKNYSYVISSSLPGTGGYWHKSGYNTQMWLDGLFMGAALSAEYLGNFGSTLSESDRNEAWDKIALQFDTIFKYTWDADKKLNYHAWAADPDVNTDTRYWADQTTGRSAEFWGRGMGWFFAAMVDVLEFMPTGEARTRLESYANQVADGLKARQDATTGCWYQLLQYDATKQGTSCQQYNWLESSASSMFTYAFYKGVRIGVLDSATYIPVAEKAYPGLIDQFITESAGKISIGRICSSAGLSSTRKGDANYYLCGSDAGSIVTNDGKAIGPFIMASLEYEKIHLLGNISGDEEEPGGGGDPVFNDCDGMIHITLNNISQEDVYSVELWKTAKEKQIVKGTLKAGKTLLYFPKVGLSGTYTYKVFNSQGIEQNALQGEVTIP